MHPAAGRAAADIGKKGEVRAAPLAGGRQPTAGHGLISQLPAMGLKNKFHQIAPLGKRSAVSGALTASAIVHR